jgi:phosphoglycerol transferase MdoB-like AlkP superfamily enzyme
MLTFHKGGGTSDIEFTVTNGILPLKNFPAFKLRNYDYPNSMVKQFNYSGYATSIYHGNYSNFFNRNIALKKIGFKNFYDINKMNLKESVWGASDSDVFNFVRNSKFSDKTNYLKYIITMSSHGPFDIIPQYYKTENFNDIKNKRVRNYFISCEYLDFYISEFINSLNRKNTYIFILGDHCPSIETEIFSHSSIKKNREYLEFVPLFILTPDNITYSENRKGVSLLDLYATILESSGIDYTIKNFGSNLLEPLQIDEMIHYYNSDFSRTELFESIRLSPNINSDKVRVKSEQPNPEN